MNNRVIDSVVLRGVEYTLEVAYEGQKNNYGEDMTRYHILDSRIVNQWGGRNLVNQGAKNYIMQVWKNRFKMA